MAIPTREEYRKTIGMFATGVTVITTKDGGRPKGMTANAVSSLSLEPLLLLVCVDRSAHTHPALKETGAFVVNILASDQEHVSRLFANPESHLSETLMDQPYRLGELGVPILEHNLAYLECRVQWVLPGGDHDIFVGEVMEIGVGREDAEPLIFYQGKYASLTRP